MIKKFDDSKNKLSLSELLDTNGFVEHISVDCVIFGFNKNVLKVLLLKYHEVDKWSVPGGFVFKNESLDDAASRTLYERTHLENLFLQQFYTFGDIERTEQNNPHRELLKSRNIIVNPDHWIYQRFISTGYFALIDFTISHTFPNTFNETCAWFPVDELPQMAFDHENVIKKGLDFLRKNLDYNIVGSNLLPEKFTMKELQTLYETILNEKFRRNNFQRKILSLNILQRLEKLYTGSANKAPYLYKFLTK
jgi:8-oxo-dGTP diphosphatase